MSAMLTRMEQRITKHGETNKKLFERIEKLNSESINHMETTPTPHSFLQQSTSLVL